MELLNIREVASVKLFTIEVTEDELDLYERCMKYVDAAMSPEEVEITFGAYQSELRGIYLQISMLLEKHSDLRRNRRK